MAAKTLGNREVKLARHPVGPLQAEDFGVAATGAPVPGPNEGLVRNRWFRVSVSTRLMAQEDARVVEGIPFPPLKLGDTLADGAIGEVIEAGAACDLAFGSIVMHPFGWRDYAAAGARDCTVLGDGAPEPAAYLGHGWTAYAALTQAIRVSASNTVFVTSGAGAIGSMAGQIARLLGVGRVIGSTDTREKAHWMRTELGYDTVVTRDGGHVLDQLMRIAPGEIDVVVDMVGGEQLAAAVSLARTEARCVILGALTAELDLRQAGLRAPVELDSFQFILKGGDSARLQRLRGGLGRVRGLAAPARRMAAGRQAPPDLHDRRRSRSRTPRIGGSMRGAPQKSGPRRATGRGRCLTANRWCGPRVRAWNLHRSSAVSCFMSVAFVKEPEGGEAFENLPDRPISPHTNFVTPEGLAQIEAEVARLEKEVAFLDPADKAEDSRIGRDLRYWAARKNTAQLVEPKSGDTVQFGSTVTVVREDDSGKETRQTFRIVGEDEADPHKGSISYVAPLARAITGKSVGDVVEVNGHGVEVVEIR